MKDSDRSHLHLNKPSLAFFQEEWAQHMLEFDDIEVPPELEPPNPDETDDGAIPDPQAVFGVLKANARARQPAWKDLGAMELFSRPEGTFDDTLVAKPDFSETKAKAKAKVPR